MIQLTRINHVCLVLNSDLIEHIEITPDTVISMTTGQKFMVLETSAEVIERVIAFRKAICEGIAPCPLVSTQRVTDVGSDPGNHGEEEAAGN